MRIEGILVGLGNPGKEYANTRHNFGFMLVDHLVAMASEQNWGNVEKLSSSKQKFELWRAWLSPAPALPWLLLKPLTYMNLSGEAVAPVINYYHIPPEKLIVAHDEMDLPLGRMRLKQGGSAAGHKGIISLDRHLGTNGYYRLRLGIGKRAGSNTVNHVIGAFGKAEEKIVSQIVEAAAKIIVKFPELGFETTQQLVNSFKITEE